MGLGASVGQIYATSIALRFAHMRRQFSKSNSEPENPLISYQLHQYRLIPKFSRGFILKFGVDEIL